MYIYKTYSPSGFGTFQFLFRNGILRVIGSGICSGTKLFNAICSACVSEHNFYVLLVPLLFRNGTFTRAICSVMAVTEN